ncbi:MAG TPA: hypothetical protein VJY12_10030 [Dysgonamonadaceae bacterium]|nr:hypothetical protein [Dysgonamonadaceae bacterium]
MKTKSSLPKSRKNYYVDIAALVPFLMLLFTGIIMLMYHTGTSKLENILSRDGHFWLNTHIAFAIISSMIILVHLSLHLNWFRKLFSAKRNKYWFRNLMLVILFFVTAFTSFIPLLILEESTASSMILGIHNKFGLLLIAFFIIHLLSYSKWLISTTQKVFIKNTKKEV